MASLIKKNEKKVLIIGDSHSIILGGNTMKNKDKPPIFDKVSVCHLGAALCYNLLDDKGNNAKWGNLIFNFMNSPEINEKKYDYVIFSFGEIDIRTQVIRQAILQDKSIYEIVNIITDKLLAFSKKFYENFRIITLLWEPVASSNLKIHHDESFPFVGSMKERNLATEVFSNLLIEKTKKYRDNGIKIYSFGIYKKMSSYYKTLDKYLFDSIHLNLSGLSLALNSLHDLCRRENLDVSNYFNYCIPSNKKPILKNINSEVSFELSSEYKKPSSLYNHFNRGFCFHTKEENNPFVRIDIGYETSINKIEIYNSSNFKARASTLMVFIGKDMKNMNLLDKVHWNNINEPLIINFEKETFFKIIQLQLNERNFFHLSKINIFKYSLL